MSLARAAVVAACLTLLGADPARAHELRPGYLELTEQADDSWRFHWKGPAGGEVEIRIAPAIPEGCRLEGADAPRIAPGAVVVRGTLTCDGGLAGRTLRVQGLESTTTDVLVRLERVDGSVETHLLRPAAPSLTVGGSAPRGGRALSYLSLGAQHVALGADHLLFVLGLLLIVADRWTLVKTVTSFTVAHSLTLALATLGRAQAPLPPLNAAIALSILFLGPEIARTWRGESSFTLRHPWVVAFAFGLLHGFGFATGLASMGLPKSEIPIALLLFNVGVEAGQVAFVVIVILLERSFAQLEMPWPRWARMLPGYVVGTLGAFWTLQRTVLLLGGSP